ncbi:Ribosomal silencing factor RsfS [Anaerohalosphaera lusitana]|uniref:Ribosomal silencing factor RsfS n=1 Tax=Anaerohalosphaera lusitana TaxID=1936003 RepID=A0A1U9NIV0_9BACT|nr:ribosome silencing factor [Anaerohalosphaera lusitana]AQT67520.1 Ribosomal silencing factor RsfS [Anaerohalosphaera lusitana]
MVEKQVMDNKEFAFEAAKIAAGLNCTDVKVVDLRGKSPATEFFVIATSTSARQSRTVADDIDDFAEEAGHARYGRAGYDIGRWILLDYVDVVVHVFDAESRDYYQLESLWGDAKEYAVAE